mmetsp:Transcript_32994/g.129528  ORF Transcript_32994/g.129528 Transcript_32994/m.129528 type:complete len:856 (-) Transcript_32994:984-3551(-)
MESDWRSEFDEAQRKVIRDWAERKLMSSYADLDMPQQVMKDKVAKFEERVFALAGSKEIYVSTLASKLDMIRKNREGKQKQQPAPQTTSQASQRNPQGAGANDASQNFNGQSHGQVSSARQSMNYRQNQRGEYRTVNQAPSQQIPMQPTSQLHQNSLGAVPQVQTAQVGNRTVWSELQRLKKEYGEEFHYWAQSVAKSSRVHRQTKERVLEWDRILQIGDPQALSPKITFDRIAEVEKNIRQYIRPRRESQAGRNSGHPMKRTSSSSSKQGGPPQMTQAQYAQQQQMNQNMKRIPQQGPYTGNGGLQPQNVGANVQMGNIDGRTNSQQGQQASGAQTSSEYSSQIPSHLQRSLPQGTQRPAPGQLQDQASIREAQQQILARQLQQQQQQQRQRASTQRQMQLLQQRQQKQGSQKIAQQIADLPPDMQAQMSEQLGQPQSQRQMVQPFSEQQVLQELSQQLLQKRGSGPQPTNQQQLAAQLQKRMPKQQMHQVQQQIAPSNTTQMRPATGGASARVAQNQLQAQQKELQDATQYMRGRLNQGANPQAQVPNQGKLLQQHLRHSDNAQQYSQSKLLAAKLAVAGRGGGNQQAKVEPATSKDVGRVGAGLAGMSPQQVAARNRALMQQQQSAQKVPKEDPYGSHANVSQSMVNNGRPEVQNNGEAQDLQMLDLLGGTAVPSGARFVPASSGAASGGNFQGARGAPNPVPGQGAQRPQVQQRPRNPMEELGRRVERAQKNSARILRIVQQQCMNPEEVNSAHRKIEVVPSVTFRSFQLPFFSMASTRKQRKKRRIDEALNSFKNVKPTLVVAKRPDANPPKPPGQPEKNGATPNDASRVRKAPSEGVSQAAKVAKVVYS